MSIYEFMTNSPFLTFFIIVGIGIILDSILTFCFKCINRSLRTINIRKNGWPPEHCDADGDFKPNEPED